MLKTQAVAGEVEEVPHDGEEKPDIGDPACGGLHQRPEVLGSGRCRRKKPLT